MNVSILIITHGEIGTALLHAAQGTFGDLPLPITAVSIESETDPTVIVEKLKQLRQTFEQNNSGGLLVLTDLFGSTPSNVCKNLMKEGQDDMRVVTGVNLPMLVRVMNYPDLPLGELAEKAYSGGVDGIKYCDCDND